MDSKNKSGYIIALVVAIAICVVYIWWDIPNKEDDLNQENLIMSSPQEPMIAEAWLLDVGIENEGNIILSCNEIYSMKRFVVKIPVKISTFRNRLTFVTDGYDNRVYQVIRAYYPEVDFYVNYSAAEISADRIIEKSKNASGDRLWIECVLSTASIKVTVSEYLMYSNFTENVTDEDSGWKFIRNVSHYDRNYDVYPRYITNNRGHYGYDFEFNLFYDEIDEDISHDIVSEILKYEHALNYEYSYGRWWHSDDLSVEVRH